MARNPRQASRAPPAARILGFEVGADFWYGTTLVRIVRVAGPDKLLVRHLATQRLEHLSCTVLRAVDSDATGAMRESLAVEQYPPQVWERARAVQKVVEALESRRTPSRAAEARAARDLGVSSRHLRRWRAQFRALGTLEAFLPRRAGRKGGTLLLNPRLEQLIGEELRQALRRSADVAVNDLYPLICEAARAIRVGLPARSTVARRLAALKRDASNFAPGTARALMDKRLPVHGRLKTSGALSIVQMDHTLADVILVDPIDHRPIGRPWLTLALDVHTRMVLGMLLSLEAPSSLSVALALEHAVFPKQTWVQRLGIEAEGWTGFGLPRTLHLDNGADFKARALVRGCELYGIGLNYRPVATPRFGGHIERMIGTMMGKVRLLPGATMSRTLRQRPKRTEKGARFTLADLTVYLARQVGIYHHSTHSGIERSPRSAWEQAFKRGDSWALPHVPADRQDFLVRFLPSEMRTVTREGVRLFALRYQSHELEQLIAPGKPRFVRYDPRDLSRIFVEDDDRRTLAVPLSDRHWPVMSLWEWEEIRRRQLAGSHGGDAEWVARALRANQALIEGRANAGRLRDRRRLERARQWDEVRPPALHANRELIVSATLKDTPLPCEVLE
jgi:putative transposase